MVDYKKTHFELEVDLDKAIEILKDAKDRGDSVDLKQIPTRLIVVEGECRRVEDEG